MPTLRPPVESVPIRNISTLGSRVETGAAAPAAQSPFLDHHDPGGAHHAFALLTPLMFVAAFPRNSGDVKTVPVTNPVTNPVTRRSPGLAQPRRLVSTGEGPREHHHRHSGHSETKHNGVTSKKREDPPPPQPSSSPQQHPILVE